MNINRTKQFLLTGPPGCGKTTLVKKVCTNLQKHNIPIYGFYTEELKINGKRQGFDVVTLDNKRSPLARVLEPGVKHSGPVVGKYGVDKTAFEQAVLPLLAKQAHTDRGSARIDVVLDIVFAVPPVSIEKGAVIIDEIGKMELFSNDFAHRVKQIFKENRVILATVPIKPLPYVNQLKSANPSAVIIEVTHNNRDNLESELSQSIIKALNG